MENVKRAVVAVLRLIKLKPPLQEQEELSSEEIEAFSAKIRRNRRSLPAASSRVALITSSAGVPHLLASTNYSLSIIEGLLQNGVDARLIATQQRKLPVLNDSLLMSDIFIPAFSKRIYSEQLLQDVFHSQRFDHVLSISAPIKQMAAQAQLIRSAGASHIHYSGESPVRVFPDEEEREQFIRLVRESFDGILTVSDYLRDYWVGQGFSKKEICVFRVPAREDVFHRRSSHSIGNHAMYVGNLSHGEVDDLLVITRLVLSDIKDFTLSIFADADSDRRKQLETRIAEMGLQDSISINSALSLEDLANKEVSADVLLLPRRSGEFSKAGFPNKMGEYLMSGTPVVYSDVGEIREVIGDERAFFVEADNPGAFAKRLVEVLSDTSSSRQIGYAGRRWALENVGSRRVAELMLAWMDDLKAQR